jgi:hypothetical protein
MSSARTIRGLRGLAALMLAALLLIVVAAAVSVFSTNPAPWLSVPSAAGLNYGAPHTMSGEWVGTEWLRPGEWQATRPALAADLDFIQQHNLGKVIRLFVGLDQTMVWKANEGFDGFDESALDNFSATLDMLDARGLKIVAVLYDQEVVGSTGNFHFEALDGKHAIMRRNYLRATDEFLRRFGKRSTVIGWDLFNEAYNSLGQDGHLPPPPHADPVSPQYSDQVVHDWLRDLYRVAKAAAPPARFTVSDTTEIYWNPDPNLGLYSDVVDFYDVHIYDDHPRYPSWLVQLRKPFIVGEAGASTANGHYDNQALNSVAVDYLLAHAQAAGASTVLAQGQAFSPNRDALTPTGAAVAGFLAADGRGPGAGWDPAGAVKGAVVDAGRRLKRLLGW